MKTHLAIRNLDLGTGVAVSPMVGITDLPFRRMCRAFGADLAFCEMIAGPALVAIRKGKLNSKHLRILGTESAEKPFAVQLFGSHPDALYIGAQVAAENGADIIDLNMGCPTKRVAGNGSGSGLLRDPDHARRCVAAIRSAVPQLPFTVKMRAGWDGDHVNCVEIARMSQEEGVDAVTVHGRLRTQTYHNPANWEWIADVVKAVKIPVLGNGDVMSADDAVAMVKRTGCAGVMLARGVRGNPWLIREVKAALSGEAVPPAPSALAKLDVFLVFWRDMVEFRSFRHAINDIRKHLIWFSKGLHGATELRRDLPLLTDEQTLVARATAFFQAAHERETRSPSDGITS